MIELARRRPTLLAWTVLLLIAAVCAVGCRAAFPVAIDQATVPAAIRDSSYQTNNVPGSPSTSRYSGIKWFVYEARGSNRLVASTATELQTSGSGTGASSSTLLWKVSLYADPSANPTEMAALATLAGPLAGTGTRPSDFQAKTSFIAGTGFDVACAGGIAFDKKIVKVVAVIADDEVSTAPVNGFWFMQHEGGTGWLEFRALDKDGKVLYTIQ